MLSIQIEKISSKKKFSSLDVVYIGNPEIGHEVFYLLNKKKKFKIKAFFTYEVNSKLKKFAKKNNFKIIKVPKYNFKNTLIKFQN